MSQEHTQNTVTQLLAASRAGDARSLEQLLPLVYSELRQVAQRQMKGENTGHTLQATALVHEAFLRLSGSDVAWQDRVHFFALAASTMRRILVDHAKAKRRGKRGGGAILVPLEDALYAANNTSPDLAAVDEALTRLAARDERKARVVELHFFAGLTYEEIAEVLAISPATVDRDLRFAKAWLFTELRDQEA